MALAALVACSGGDSAESTDGARRPSATEVVNPSAATTTSAAKPAGTVPQDAAGSAQGAELCRVLAADMASSQNVDVFDPDALEEATRRSLAALEQMKGEVPDELQDDFVVLVAANKDYVALLEENDWDLFVISEDDPRVSRMSSKEVLAASEAIADFCDLGPGGSGSSDTTVSGAADDLMPPGAGQVLATEPILMVESSASYEDLVDHYAGVFGRGPVDESEEGGSAHRRLYNGVTG